MSVAHFTPAAKKDLSTIWDYTEKQWGIKQAEKYTEDIVTVCDDLCNSVIKYQSAEEVREGYSKVLCGRHVIFFRIHEDKEIIEIVRIVHQDMDVEL